MVLKAVLEVKFLVLAKGEGPDSLSRDQGMPAYEKIRGNALTAMGFACRSTLPNPVGASAELKSRAASSLSELIVQVESEATRSQFLAEFAQYLRLPLAPIQHHFATHAGPPARLTPL